MRTRRLPALLLAGVAALALSACGTKEDNVLVGETEGIYVDIGEVKYQVQMSRILNVDDIEDQAYLQGVPAIERDLEEGEVWFGVWMRAENESDEPQPKVEEFEIHDTLGEVYEPVDLGPEATFSWENQPDQVPPQGIEGGIVPVADSPAAESTIQGALLLFKLSYATLENRPLELEFPNPANPSEIGKINLDV
jgi:hypothetical protein